MRRTRWQCSVLHRQLRADVVGVPLVKGGRELKLQSMRAEGYGGRDGGSRMNEREHSSSGGMRPKSSISIDEGEMQHPIRGRVFLPSYRDRDVAWGNYWMVC